MKIYNYGFWMVAIFVSLILYTQKASAQSIDAGLGIGYASHVANYDYHNPSKDLLVPSLGSFYGDNFAFSSDFQFCFLSNKSSPLLQFSYDYESLNASISSPSILGDKLSINSFEFSIGFGIYYASDTTSFLFFPTIGYVIKSYKGKNEVNSNLIMKINYSRGAALRLGMGAKIMNMVVLPISIMVRVYYDFGTVRRGNIEIDESGGNKEVMIPTGDLVLPDNIISVHLTFAYHLVL